MSEEKDQVEAGGSEEAALTESAPAAKKSVRISKKSPKKKTAPKKTKEKLEAKQDSGSNEPEVNEVKTGPDGLKEEVIPLGGKKQPKQVVRNATTKKSAKTESKDGDSSSEKQGDSDQASQNQPSGGGRRSRGGRRSGGGGNRQDRPAIEVDQKKLEKKAWKIFLSEVSEEGLALINRQDAHRLSERSYEVARAFLEETERLKKK